MNNKKMRFATVALAICMVFASVAVLAPLCNFLQISAAIAPTTPTEPVTVEKVEHRYAYLSAVKQAPTYWESIYNRNDNRYRYELNHITVAEGCKVNTFSVYIKNSATADKTVQFVVAAFDGEDKCAALDNPAIKIKMTVVAGFSGYMNIAVPDGVTIGAGDWLYGINQPGDKGVSIGLAHGDILENEDITVNNLYYGKITASKDESESDPDYRILSYVSYEKKTGETEEILPENYTKLTKGKAHVILMGGQSNATGNTRIQDLKNIPDAYTEGYDNILINYNRDQYAAGASFEPVKLGQGRVDDNYGALYGPEVGLADYLNSNFPGEKFYIIKAAFSGTALHDSWAANGACYIYFADIVQTALKQLEAEGLEPEIFAMCWMQGESDAITSQSTMEQTLAYAENETALFNRIEDRFRAYVAPGGMAVLDAAIYDGSGSTAPNCIWTLGGLINHMKRVHASLSQNYYFLDSNKTDIDPVDDFGFQEYLNTIDLAHYDGDDMIELGKLFGKGVRRVIVNGGEQVEANAPIISRGKTATASNSRVQAYYKATTLTDARYGETMAASSSRSSIGWVNASAASTTTPTELAIALGETYQIKTVKVYAANPAGTFTEGLSYLPADYEIQIYTGTEWQTVATETGASLPYATGAAMTYTLETPVEGTDVRMLITKDGANDVSMVSEIEVYGYSTTAQETREFEVNAENRDEIIVTLDSYSWIYDTSLVGESALPTVTYAVSNDGGLTWAETDFAEPAFANAIRVTVVEGDGASIGAISVTGVFGEPAAPAKEPIEPDTDAEWYPETEPETETETETQSESEVESVLETRPETKPETQPETDPETAPETVAGTVAETVVETDEETVEETKIETKGETTVETAAPETDAPASVGGCTSVVGLGAMSVLIAAAAIVLKKRD